MSTATITVSTAGGFGTGSSWGAVSSARAASRGQGAQLRAGRAPVGGVRLTRRGRLALVAVLAVLLFAAFSLGRVGAEGSTDAPAEAVRTVTVVPGDTLWSLASELAPGRDPRPLVEQIRQLNDLPGGGLRAGQQLLVPAAS